MSIYRPADFPRLKPGMFLFKSKGYYRWEKTLQFVVIARYRDDAVLLDQETSKLRSFNDVIYMLFCNMDL